MDLKIRKAQGVILDVFAKEAEDFALAGGTALELYYLHHRFSRDLDFFSPKYDVKEIERLIAAFEKRIKNKIKLQSEFTIRGRARVHFYIVPVKGSRAPLKIDFVEDVIFTKPGIKRIKGVRVYSAEGIYLQKITAVAGVKPTTDEIGRETIEGGRREARDAFDIYMLSKKIKPLHLFLKSVPRHLQRGMIHWYRSFSRQEMKLGLLDLDIYDKKFNSKEMINYLENEIKEFAKGAIA
ncbi:MAG: nucleotidyl transferase AbiEii/AbiGii toxin family protein [Candidatus Omnitrophota bacterium]|nr:nucleotidyl transferase AbiEii/AbiGii toxin family protein [Candidatus Omnitrophota bacterium]